MRISVRAKTGARQASVEAREETLADGRRCLHFVVAVREPAIEGRANRAIARALAYYFQVARSRVRIVLGETSRDKVVELHEQGLSQWDISQKLGVSRASVGRIIAERKAS